ncbi:hypothetical protein [Kitasatospora sp. NPDC101183]|uniref:hypothetical protein n=1 Tax=Kitasatospora sp. NPDC101183 TaxID=3364100 RepID=UPI00382EB4FC
MTTAGSNGVPEGQGGGAPQDDDPFGYLYRPAEGSPASPASPAEPQQGVPRTSYNRPMEVGRAQYGQGPRGPQAPYEQQGHPQQYGQPQYGQQQPPYGHQQGEYGQQQGAEHGAAPTQQNRYAEHSRPQPGEERPGREHSSGRSKGAVIGAVAVVAAIAIGAGIALSGSDPDTDKNAKGGTSTVAPPVPTTPATGSGTGTPSASASATSGPGTVDASQLQGQNAPSGNTVKGAKSADGGYLTLQPGGSVSWTGDIPTAGAYKLNVHYNYAGADIKGAVSVNGKDWPSGITYKVYGGAAPKDQASAWFNTWILPQFQAGSNTVTFTVPSGGPVLIDQITIEPGTG